MLEKEGMRDVETMKYLPWLGQHHQGQNKELWMELGAVNVIIQPHRIPPLPSINQPRHGLRKTVYFLLKCENFSELKNNSYGTKTLQYLGNRFTKTDENSQHKHLFLLGRPERYHVLGTEGSFKGEDQPVL